MSALGTASSPKQKEAKISWYILAFMSFTTVWGFGNVINGFAYFHGTQVITSWIGMFILYFIPYALMCAELGSAFKEAGAGTSSWVMETMSPKLAYYCGFTYWATTIPYIISKESYGINAVSWMFLKNDWYNNLPAWQIQLITGVVFFFFLWVASRGIQPMKILTTIGGSSIFVMSMLFIVMMFTAPLINPAATYVPLDFSWKNLIPALDLQYLINLSILVFAVGGCEKIAPYINKVKDPGQNFPKTMLMLAAMVIICAVLGSIALGMMFPASAYEGARQAHFVANGAYEAFLKLGEYYGAGSLFVILYGACNAIAQFSAMVFSIDAPLRMLLDDEAARLYVPRALLKKNRYGAYGNGIILVGVLCSAIIFVQMFGEGAADIITWITRLNAVCMPLQHLWVFLAYVMLRRHSSRFPREYEFVKNKTLAITIGWWCFFVTLVCSLTGIYAPGDAGRTLINALAPFLLLGLGLIMPEIRKYSDRKQKR